MNEGLELPSLHFDMHQPIYWRLSGLQRHPASLPTGHGPGHARQSSCDSRLIPIGRKCLQTGEVQGAGREELLRAGMSLNGLMSDSEIRSTHPLPALLHCFSCTWTARLPLWALMMHPIYIQPGLAALLPQTLSEWFRNTVPRRMSFVGQMSGGRCTACMSKRGAVTPAQMACAPAQAKGVRGRSRLLGNDYSRLDTSRTSHDWSSPCEFRPVSDPSLQHHIDFTRHPSRE